MKQPFTLAVFVLSIAYPFLIYWGLQHYSASRLIPLLFLLLGLRWIIGGKSYERITLIAIMAILAVIVLVWGHRLGLKFYPVMVNLGFLSLFLTSLFFPPPIIERMARLQKPDLPPDAVVYTYWLTWIWSAFFILNGSLAALTAIWGSDKLWAVYNGFIAYVLIGILIAGEWLVRRLFVKN